MLVPTAAKEQRFGSETVTNSSSACLTLLGVDATQNVMFLKADAKEKSGVFCIAFLT